MQCLCICLCIFLQVIHRFSRFFGGFLGFFLAPPGRSRFFSAPTGCLCICLCMLALLLNACMHPLPICNLEIPGDHRAHLRPAFCVESGDPREHGVVVRQGARHPAVHQQQQVCPVLLGGQPPGVCQVVGGEKPHPWGGAQDFPSAALWATDNCMASIIRNTSSESCALARPRILSR